MNEGSEHMTNSTSDLPSIEVSGNWWRLNSRRLWLVASLTLLLVVVWWFLRSPVAITKHTIVSGSVVAEVLGTGTLEARTSATIGPKMSGLISRVSVDQGERVKAGDTLIYLEDIDFKQQVGVAEAEMAAATAAMDRLQADQRRAEAVLKQASLTNERSQASRNALSAQDVDKARESLAVAGAELARTKAAIVEGDSRRTATERNLEFQRARLHDTTIEAPFDALVVRRDREAGDVVSAGSSVLQLVSTDEMWIRAWVDETELARLAEGQPARTVFRSEPSVEYPGMVVRVGREADRETREILVDVLVQKLPAKWAIGQRAEVYIQVDHKENVMTLPAEFVLVRDGKTGVMVDKQPKARWREITVGLRGRDNLEVSTGLAIGDVIVSPLRAAYP